MDLFVPSVSSFQIEAFSRSESKMDKNKIDPIAIERFRKGAPYIGREPKKFGFNFWQKGAALLVGAVGTYFLVKAFFPCAAHHVSYSRQNMAGATIPMMLDVQEAVKKISFLKDMAMHLLSHTERSIVKLQTYLYQLLSAPLLFEGAAGIYSLVTPFVPGAAHHVGYSRQNMVGAAIPMLIEAQEAVEKIGISLISLKGMAIDLLPYKERSIVKQQTDPYHLVSAPLLLGFLDPIFDQPAFSVEPICKVKGNLTAPSALFQNFLVQFRRQSHYNRRSQVGPYCMNTDPLAKPSVVNSSRAFTPKLNQKILKESTRIVVQKEIDSMTRMGETVQEVLANMAAIFTLFLPVWVGRIRKVAFSPTLEKISKPDINLPQSSPKSKKPKSPRQDAPSVPPLPIFGSSSVEGCIPVQKEFILPSQSERLLTDLVLESPKVPALFPIPQREQPVPIEELLPRPVELARKNLPIPNAPEVWVDIPLDDDDEDPVVERYKKMALILQERSANHIIIDMPDDTGDTIIDMTHNPLEMMRQSQFNRFTIFAMLLFKELWQWAVHNLGIF